MLSKLNVPFKNKSFRLSIGIHGVIVLLFTLLFYFEKPLKNNELTFTVVEKFKVIPESKSAVVKITKPKVKKKAVKKKRQVFGLSRKSMTSTNEAAIKKGNTVAKTPDNKKLRKDDEDSIPIPTDEFLITSMPAVLEEIRPQYPEEAKKQGIQGKVIFEIIVDNKGNVRQAVLTKSLGDAFDLAAKEAIMRFKFRPAMMDKQAVAVKIKYAINFVLEK